MTERRSNNISMNNVVVYILVVMCLAISSWSLKTQIDMGNKLVGMEVRIGMLEENTARDEAQDKLLEDRKNNDSKHWRFLSNLNSRTMVLELKQGITPKEPDLRD
jgi:hypothetical protein